MRTLTHCLVMAVLLAGIWATWARMAGFAQKKQSTTAPGNAFAGTTVGANDFS